MSEPKQQGIPPINPAAYAPEVLARLEEYCAYTIKEANREVTRLHAQIETLNTMQANIRTWKEQAMQKPPTS